ncbi:unnamed protein product, partial [Brassica oleracea var. botrytis]
MFCLESMLVPLDSEVKFTSLFVRVKESSALMSELSQEKTISAMFWCERGIIFGSYISGFNLFPTRLTVLVQCFTKHLLKSSQSRSFSTNNFWPTLPKCMRRPQLVTSSSRPREILVHLLLLKGENHSTNIPLCKRSSYPDCNIRKAFQLLHRFAILFSGLYGTRRCNQTCLSDVFWR